MRWMIVGMWCAGWTAVGAPADAAAPPVPPGCTARDTGWDFQQLDCPVTATGRPQRWRFQAHFSGGHDDTIASLQAQLDGAPLDCEAGSKTRLMGEDGDVSLHCDFSIDGATGTPRVAQFVVKWQHAQYERVELVAP